MWKNKKIIIALSIIIAVCVMGVEQYRHKQAIAQFSDEEREQLKLSYQVTQDTIAELTLIHKVNNTNEQRSKLNIAPRQPRHLWHKAHTILLEIDHLKEYKNLPATGLSPFLDHVPNVQDINHLLHNVLKEAKALRKAYNITDTPKPAPKTGSILPIDVYENLDLISRMISALERSENIVIEPTHVYQLAKTIVAEVKKISGVIAMPDRAVSSGKRPRDVYNQAHILLRKVKQLSDNHGYGIEGGVVLLEKDGGHIVPADVFNILTNILAEVEAIRHATGDNSILSIEPAQKKKTPSNVYDKVSEAIAIVETLL